MKSIAVISTFAVLATLAHASAIPAEYKRDVSEIQHEHEQNHEHSDHPEDHIAEYDDSYSHIDTRAAQAEEYQIYDAEYNPNAEEDEELETRGLDSDYEDEDSENFGSLEKRCV